MSQTIVIKDEPESTRQEEKRESSELNTELLNEQTDFTIEVDNSGSVFYTCDNCLVIYTSYWAFSQHKRSCPAISQAAALQGQSCASSDCIVIEPESGLDFYFRCIPCSECFFTQGAFVDHCRRTHCRLLVSQGNTPQGTLGAKSHSELLVSCRCTACGDCFYTEASFCLHTVAIHCKVLVCQGQNSAGSNTLCHKVSQTGQWSNTRQETKLNAERKTQNRSAIKKTVCSSTAADYTSHENDSFSSDSSLTLLETQVRSEQLFSAAQLFSPECLPVVEQNSDKVSAFPSVSDNCLGDKTMKEDSDAHRKLQLLSEGLLKIAGDAISLASSAGLTPQKLNELDLAASLLVTSSAEGHSDTTSKKRKFDQLENIQCKGEQQESVIVSTQDNIGISSASNLLCEVCKETFSSVDYLQSHLVQHIGNIPQTSIRNFSPQTTSRKLSCDTAKFNNQS